MSQEIYWGNFAEKIRYEKHMDQFRALALWISQHKDHPLTKLAFDTIKDYSVKFALDILSFNEIPEESLESFTNSMALIRDQLGITQADIEEASQSQKDSSNGFWEMRRVIGQFGDAASEINASGTSHIITAGISGCIIAEYLALLISQNHHRQIPVDHMVFSRRGIQPSEGILKPKFKLSGREVLLVDDAVMETTTLGVMIKKLESLSPEFSLLTVDISPKIRNSGYLGQFRNVHLFEE